MIKTVTPLNIRRAGRLVLAGVELDIAIGQIAVLRAPNGGGKTTLLRSLAGLIPIDQGAVHFGDAEPVFCGHLDAVKSAMSVKETLEFWRSIYGTAENIKALSALGLEDLIDTPVSLLSAGQKRRLGLARAFVSGARVKLFDEPTTALDQTHRMAFFDLIEACAAEGDTILMSSHDEAIPQSASLLDLAAFKPSAEEDQDDPFLSEAFS